MRGRLLLTIATTLTLAACGGRDVTAPTPNLTKIGPCDDEIAATVAAHPAPQSIVSGTELDGTHWTILNYHPIVDRPSVWTYYLFEWRDNNTSCTVSRHDSFWGPGVQIVSPLQLRLLDH